jgi:CRISPR-associated protein Csb2
MIALRLRFPAGRYHATPWGRHVNEAAIAWPPEPLRILRALIACHHRKADRARFADESLADLVDALAPQLPVYRLPETVHAHTRHYVPAPVKTTLVFDAFARFDPQEPLVVGWPGAALSSELRPHLEHLAARLGYLGRAESWVEAEVIDWDGEGANARPFHGDRNNTGSNAGDTDQRLTSVYAPLTPSDYRQCREKLIAEERVRRRTSWTKKGQPTDKALEKDMKDFLATLPERLVYALAVDTSDLQAVGWSDPPAARRVLYAAPEPATAWQGGRLKQAVRKRPAPTVARFVLAGRPRPRVEDTVRIAEIMRLAAMTKFGWTIVGGKRRPNAPSVISGYGDDGKPLRDDGHAHAFWLPEDADGDGEVDHMVVYSPAGLDGDCRKALDLVTRLWIEKRARDDEDEVADGGRKEWRLALEGFGRPKDFASGSAFFGSPNTKTWISTTPYLMPWHAKKGFGWAEQIARELKERGLPSLAEPPSELCSIRINGRERRPIHFHRFRSRRGLRQPDTLGRFLELTFEVPFEGPLALGFGCHFGLGLFAAVNLPAG